MIVQFSDTWQPGKGSTGDNAEKMKSVPKAVKHSPIYFSRTLTFYTKGGCGPIFFLCFVFLFTIHGKAEIVITLRLV